ANAGGHSRCRSESCVRSLRLKGRPYRPALQWPLLYDEPHPTRGPGRLKIGRELRETKLERKLSRSRRPALRALERVKAFLEQADALNDTPQWLRQPRQRVANTAARVTAFCHRHLLSIARPARGGAY